MKKSKDFALFHDVINDHVLSVRLKSINSVTAVKKENGNYVFTLFMSVGDPWEVSYHLDLIPWGFPKNIYADGAWALNKAAEEAAALKVSEAKAKKDAKAAEIIAASEAAKAKRATKKKTKAKAKKEAAE